MEIKSEFRVLRGEVVEKESGKGIPNLLVKAWLKKPFVELEHSITAKDGCFQLMCPWEVMADQSESEIILSVIAPPWRRLKNLQQTVSWQGKGDPWVRIDLLERELGWLSPGCSEDTVEVELAVPREDFNVVERGVFSFPKLKNAPTLGFPGAPALPSMKHYIVYSRNKCIGDIDVIPGEGDLFAGITNPFPAQKPRVYDDIESGADESHISRIDKRFISRVFPKILVDVVYERVMGPVKVAELLVRPVEYSTKATGYILYRKLKYSVSFTSDKMSKTNRDDRPERVMSRQMDFLSSFTEKDNVFLCRSLFWDWGDILLRRWPKTPYVIITDNYYWPESVDLPDGGVGAPGMHDRGEELPGDIVKEFNHLARWKTSIGLFTRVISISSIVDGNFGDFTGGGFSRDLQEVIRHFLKFACNEWGTEYVLLGGDVNVVPIRKLIGRSESGKFGCWKVADNPPAEKKFYCLESSTGKVVKMHLAFEPTEDDSITNMEGSVIPYNPLGGNGERGWYYTSDDSFNDTTITSGFENVEGPTNKIIVEGFEDSFVPESGGSRGPYLMWIHQRNRIPSDFYYSSLLGEEYSQPGIHDFDTNNNGHYGEYSVSLGTESDTELAGFIDSFKTNPDVWVGRASVESSAEARAFVQKVIQYERLYIRYSNIRDCLLPFGSSLIPESAEWLRRDLRIKNYLKKVIFGQSNQYAFEDTSQLVTSDSPPGEGEYNCINLTTGLPCTSSTDSCEYRIHLQVDLTMNDSVPYQYCMWEYLSYRSFVVDSILVPYEPNNSGVEPGWCFMTNNTYSIASSVPTRFLRVSGCPWVVGEPSRHTRFKWSYKTYTDPFVENKEEVRLLVKELFPQFNHVERYYESFYPYPPPPEIEHLTIKGIRTSLDHGAHFLSLLGHGALVGCCGVDIFDNPVFNNSESYFIAFVDSCNTAYLDQETDDSLAEHSTIYPNGGAVGYVGNTRVGSSITGTLYEKAFWSDLARYKVIGIAANLGAELGSNLWHKYTQNLFGDPSMKVWTSIPLIPQISHSSVVQAGGVLLVEGSITLRSRLTETPKVTLLGGWHDDGRRPDVLITKEVTLIEQELPGPPSLYPTFQGFVSFDIPRRCPGKLTLTVHGLPFVPYVASIQVLY